MKIVKGDKRALPLYKDLIHISKKKGKPPIGKNQIILENVIIACPSSRILISYTKKWQNH